MSSLFSLPTVALQLWKTLIIFSKILVNAFRSLMLSLGLILSAKKWHYLRMQYFCQSNILWALWDLDSYHKQLKTQSKGLQLEYSAEILVIL